MKKSKTEKPTAESDGVEQDPVSKVLQIKEWTFVVPSNTRPNWGHVVERDDYDLVCGCESSYFRGECSHARLVEDFLSKRRSS